MRIVTDGKQFAVKKGWFTPQFLDLKNAESWWVSPEWIEKYCWGTEKEARFALEEYRSRKKAVRKHWKVKD